jgi:hypothetical protein
MPYVHSGAFPDFLLVNIVETHGVRAFRGAIWNVCSKYLFPDRRKSGAQSTWALAWRLIPLTQVRLYMVSATR